MKVKTYSAILCDLFRTVVSFDLRRLPRVTVEGETFRSTSGILHSILSASHPGIELKGFSRAWLGVSTEIQTEKLKTMRETNIGVRVRKVLDRLGVPEDDGAADLVHKMAGAHMASIDRCTKLPVANRRALEGLRRRARLALVSNFDSTETGRAILGRLGLEGYFEAVVISDELGWRKPHPAAFRVPLERMGIEPSRALFVGDSPNDDILGAKSAGLDAAWVNSDGERLPPGIPQPDFVLGSFAELPVALGFPLDGPPPAGERSPA